MYIIILAHNTLITEQAIVSARISMLYESILATNAGRSVLFPFVICRENLTRLPLVKRYTGVTFIQRNSIRFVLHVPTCESKVPVLQFHKIQKETVGCVLQIDLKGVYTIQSVFWRCLIDGMALCCCFCCIIFIA